MNSNLEKLNPQEIGKTVEKTTNYLKKLSDYIENKLYDSEGNTKQGGVKSLSLTFAMLVGFSLAILVVSSIFISFILINKSNTITDKEKEIVKLEVKLDKEEKNSDYWEKRYNNVYSQCDSIGYQRARQAFEFSNSLNQQISTKTEKIQTVIEKNNSELKQLEKFNNEIKDIQTKLK
jgi:hypothetical protein